MQFGHVNDPLENVDFSLPADTKTTIETLKEKRTGGGLSVFVGASKWGEKTWRGRIYPKQLPDNKFLGIYSQNFNAVEFGPTFYRFYSADEISQWTAQVETSPSFKFCPKFPQQITHIRRLANAGEQTTSFYQSLKGFGDHLGPLLLQLGDNFSPKSFPNLKAYLEALDPAISVSVEVRHKDWYADKNYRKDFLQLLSSLNMGTVIADTSGRRDCVHMDLTTTDAFIRFVGNNLVDSDYKRMDEWVERIKIWADQGLRSLWFFMHQNDERFVPDACIYFIKQLNAGLGTSVQAPILVMD
ncbi:DUF72 domain-containing protein [Inquilinus sp. KBS0705]|nr:DUF72 domain-containing protein [Inquilinus sp. KBS0705]